MYSISKVRFGVFFSSKTGSRLLLDTLNHSHHTSSQYSKEGKTCENGPIPCDQDFAFRPNEICQIRINSSYAGGEFQGDTEMLTFFIGYCSGHFIFPVFLKLL